ncbi:hypothetical protein MMPV_001332 [Pyropia vietnamensis]
MGATSESKCVPRPTRSGGSGDGSGGSGPNKRSARHAPAEPPSGSRSRSRSARRAATPSEYRTESFSVSSSRPSGSGFGGRNDGGGGGSVFWQAPTTGANPVRDRRGRLYPPTEEEREAEEGALRPPVIEVGDTEADWRRAEERSWLFTDLDSFPSSSFHTTGTSVAASALADDPWPLSDVWTEIDDGLEGFGGDGLRRPSADDSSCSFRAPRGPRGLRRVGAARRHLSDRTASARLSSETTLSRGPSFSATRPTALSFPLDARTAKAWAAAAASGIGHWRTSVCGLMGAAEAKDMEEGMKGAAEPDDNLAALCSTRVSTPWDGKQGWTPTPPSREVGRGGVRGAVATGYNDGRHLPTASHHARSTAARGYVKQYSGGRLNSSGAVRRQNRDASVAAAAAAVVDGGGSRSGGIGAVRGGGGRGDGRGDIRGSGGKGRRGGGGPPSPAWSTVTSSARSGSVESHLDAPRLSDGVPPPIHVAPPPIEPPPPSPPLSPALSPRASPPTRALRRAAARSASLPAAPTDPEAVLEAAAAEAAAVEAAIAAAAAVAAAAAAARQSRASTGGGDSGGGDGRPPVGPRVSRHDIRRTPASRAAAAAALATSSTTDAGIPPERSSQGLAHGPSPHFAAEEDPPPSRDLSSSSYYGVPPPPPPPQLPSTLASGVLLQRSRLVRAWRTRRAAVVDHAVYGPVLFLFAPSLSAASASTTRAPGDAGQSAATAVASAAAAATAAAAAAASRRPTMLVLADAAVTRRDGASAPVPGGAFVVATPDRTYVLCASSAARRGYWIGALRAATRGGGRGGGWHE